MITFAFVFVFAIVFVFVSEVKSIKIALWSCSLNVFAIIIVFVFVTVFVFVLVRSYLINTLIRCLKCPGSFCCVLNEMSEKTLTRKFLGTFVYYTLLNRVSLYLLLIKAWVKNSDSIINWYSNNKIYTTRNTSFCREIRWLPAQANTQLLKYDLPTCPYMPIYGLTLRIGRGPAGNGQILVFVSLFCSAY